MQMLMDVKAKNNGKIIIVGDFDIPVTSIDNPDQKKCINNDLATLDQFNLRDIYRAFHSKTVDYTFSSTAHGIYSRIDHIMGYKISFNKFKFEII